MRLAEEQNVPPYVVFADRALQDMARVLPRSHDEMLLVSGVGMHKLKVYGDVFLAEIARYLDEHPEDDRPRRAAAPAISAKAAPARPAPVMEKEEPGDTALLTWNLLSEGMSIPEAASRRNLKAETIVSHMEKLAKMGYSFNPDQFLEPERLDMIKKLFAASGSIYTKPVIDASNGEVTYLEARVARLFL